VNIVSFVLKKLYSIAKYQLI